MRDFYYILGINQTATSEDIKKAYRKLSLKFHPDKNDGDKFFTERFKEIQEAYEILIESAKRNAYDNEREKITSFQQTNKGSNFFPVIEYFKSSKPSFEFDEEITFSWKTINSNKVIIKPFGEVQPIGQKTYKIKDFKNPNLTIELLAMNTHIERQIKLTLTLKNNTYNDLFEFFKIKISEQNKNTNESSKSQQSDYNTQKTEDNIQKQSQLDAETNAEEKQIIAFIVVLVIVGTIIILLSHLSKN